MNKILHVIVVWQTRKLSFPGIDDNTLTIKKNIWLSSFASTFSIAVMTLLALVLAIPAIVEYGLVLIALSLPVIFGLPHSGRKYHLLLFPVQLSIILVTCYFMIRLGGLLYSGGLLLTGFSILFMSINLQNPRITLFLFIVYILTLIVTVVLEPVFSRTPELTDAQNKLFFIVNLTWQAGYTLIIIINNINQKKMLWELKQAEATSLKELDEAKTKLLTNISHEFRTPLTIMLGMARLIKEHPDEWFRKGSEKIIQNGHALLHLVNDLLDMARLEAGAMTVNCLQQDIITQLRYLVGSFSSVATEKNIDLQFSPHSGEFIMDFDEDKLMQIVSNLLSNALKFTPKDGKVELSTENLPSQHSLSIRVKDNGPGIAAEHLPQIFDRFYRIENPLLQSQSGSGLGLALTRELITLMNGTVSVESEPGAGTQFTITLPVTNEAPLKEKMTEIETLEFTDSAERFQINKLPPDNTSAPVVLIVEDNRDLTEYLQHILATEYRVVSAADGKSGLEQAFELIPDIIVSDVMMPVMDGIALLERLKSDIRTSHIPVVMLTAKADITSRLTGLEKGADEYLAKPFHEKELRIRLRNLIDMRERMQQHFASLTPDAAHLQDKSLKIENEFIRKIRAFMEENIAAEEFEIQQLCRQMAMSRAQLYRKFKALTGKSVFEYLRTLRLHKAKELLLTSTLNVTQVCFDVGFNNLSHFSRIFTEEFGRKPSDFRK